MRMHDPEFYLRYKGIDPRVRMTCCMPNCDEKFIACEGVAFPGTSNQGESVEMFFFCSEACYLAGIPASSCARA